MQKNMCQEPNEKNVAELLIRTKNAESEAFAELCRMYQPLISAEVSRAKDRIKESGLNGDEDDAEQTALIAFYRAACSYDMARIEVEFGLYAKICIENALVSYRRSLKHRRYDLLVEDVPGVDDPVTRVMEEEALQSLNERIHRCLSPYENRVWQLYTAGCRPMEIAKRLEKSPRSIENAIYRIRAKLRAQLRE